MCMPKYITKNRETDGKWGEYAVNKRALADAIVELMEKVK